MSNKMKVVKQQDLKDCGVASLLSIIEFYGGHVPLETLRIDTCTNKEGTTAYNLIECAKKYNFDAAGYKLEKNIILKENIILPAIVHLKINSLDHFAVLYEINKRKATLMDPAKGKVILKLSEFFDMWDGYIFTFYPNSKIITITNEKNILSLFREIIKKEKNLFLKIIISNLAFVVFSIANSIYFKILLENYLSDNIKIIIMIFLLIAIFKTFFYFIRMYFEEYLNKNLNVYLLKDFIKHLFSLPSKVIQTRSVGEIMTRVNELNNVKTLFSDIFVSIFLDLAITLMTVPILIYISKELFLILFVAFIIYLILGLIYSKVIYKRVMKNIDYEDKFNTSLIENINLFNSIKNLNMTKSVLFKIENILSNYIFDSFNLSKKVLNGENKKNIVYEICLYLINTVGIILIIKNKLTIINLILFNSLLSFFFEPLKNLIDNLPKYNFLKASLNKICEFINVEEVKEEEIKEIKNYEIRIINLSYSYNHYQNVFENINLVIEENKHILLKGKSGTGKSTICKILCKNETNYKGDITYGGINIKDINEKTIKSNILHLTQKEYLYSDTIKNNILFYRDKSLNDLKKIANICELEDVLKNKPLRYDTFVSMDSSNLSGGETQRIVLARALLNDFKVLIIDEALSEVDIETEIKIINNLKKAYQDKTIIYITHKNLDKCFDEVINLNEL